MNDLDNLFVDAFNRYSDHTRAINISKGFEEKALNHGEQIALIHSELSEGLEGIRKGLMDDKLPHRPMIEVELADAIIRIMNYAKLAGFDVAGALVEKTAYNATRAYKHGGKKF